jgi:hypothetical protein
LIPSKSVQWLSCYVQKNANDACDTGRPVVSHIDNLSIWLFSVGNVALYMSHEIWSKYVWIQLVTTRTDKRGDSGGPVVSQLKSINKHVCILKVMDMFHMEFG